MAETSVPSAADLLAVRSRVSWGAIAAGAIMALTIYIVLTMLGVALGIEVAVRRSGADLGAGAAIYSILALLLAVFFGGWATSRLAVGESKFEAVLYGLILWGVLFTGMMWLPASGIRAGFGGLVRLAAGAYTTGEGRIDVDRVASDLKRAGVDDATVTRYRGYYERVREDPGAAAEVGREMGGDPGAREAARRASWWSLVGVLISLSTAVSGSRVGSGELLQPVPILGVRRAAGDRRPPTA